MKKRLEQPIGENLLGKVWKQLRQIATNLYKIAPSVVKLNLKDQKKVQGMSLWTLYSLTVEIE